MKDKLALLWKTSRPISWVNTAYPFAAGYLVFTQGRVDALWLVGTFFFLIPYNLLMYGINDVFDYESDMRNPRKGGIEGAVTPKKFHPLIIKTSILISAPFVIFLIILGSSRSTLTLFVLIFFVIAYSAKGLRFKEIPFLDSVTSSTHFSGPLLFAYSICGTNSSGWLALGAFFAWGVASQAFGAIQDIIPDKEAKIKSIATELGAKKTVWFSIFMYLLAVLLTALIGGTSAFIISFSGLAYVINCMEFTKVSEKNSDITRTGWKRFLWLNYAVGAVVTMTLIASNMSLL